ncbi:MAG: hypothetical protein QOF76_556 [Solirubrobacteraceae bacterium]|jgi:ketosteroid isomerase-like protein|nr:hypothetical protein [Solirubrobacteraceae bacterium]
MNDTTTLTGVVADHIAAANAFDTDAVMATFAADALVNDNHREFWGTGAIRAWVETEIVGDRVTQEVVEVVEHHGDTYVRANYDGDYDKTGLPEPLTMTGYFSVAAGKIVRLFVIRNR